MSRRKQAGQSAVELGLLLPILMMILLGCVDLGRAFSVWITLSNAAREGARYASGHATAPTTDIINETKGEVAAQGLTGDVYVKVEKPQGEAGGDPVSVTATYTFSLLTSYLFGGGPIPIRAGTQMVILGGQ